MQPSTRGDERACEAGVPTRPPGILVVDDDEVVRAVLDIALGAHGFSVRLASDGREGVAVYREHAATIDLVLLDVRMPGWDGPRTLAVLRARAPRVRCCFMSGDTGEYTEQDLLALGAAAVFRKPFRFGELIPHVRHLTGCVGGRDL